MLCMTYGKMFAILATLGIILFATYLLFWNKPATPLYTQNEPSLPDPPRGESASPPELNNQSSEPAVLTENFYRWYLEGLTTKQAFTDSTEFRSALANWLTDDFITRWDTLIESTGHDPILLAQDYQGDWLQTIVATTISRSATTSLVTISLGAAPQEYALNISLTKANNSWRIQNVGVK
jgi:Protein of unknown function (DUF3828)